MWFIVAGVLLIALKLADLGPVAAWSWWVVLAPFAAALAWWTYADATGYTKRREMDKLEEKKKERRRRAMDALGIDRQAQKRGDAAQRTRQSAAAAKVEDVRAEKREQQDKVIRDSVFDSRTSSTFEDSRQKPSKK